MKKLFNKLFKKKTKTHFYPTDVWSEIAEKYEIKSKLWRYAKYLSPEAIGSGLVLYGEIYGPGIQKNYDYGLKEIEFAGFDIVIDGEYTTTSMAQYMMVYELYLPHVPVLYVGQWNQETQDRYTFNNNIEGTKVPHEGIVIKHTSGERNKVYKCINPDYLIYGEKHDVGDSH